ncbi:MULTISPECIES: GDP-L-fucose synthase family protein [Dethiosulfovibrio]|uniref:GDP-L-fucose synthase n=2 Tax=Dethiosulfovibrio TaxID=47054 RepID=A0ABS9ELS8_9BACT|nr:MULTISPECIES: GDP-L-fucose synthase [Dethiosulfovibrio]MCF4113933.1 GDP-L-fucose synthase [Dethiosulfovibrio russensis]MCF4141654.1 GDP-L-fucose synthase [Dethiosulfovibrio marinus]MCF4143929.1 GDP-L-fucose synthase [Dethiosulfovibrio acidaminovorans]
MKKQDIAEQRTYVAGHRGMAGSAIVRALEDRGAKDIITKTHRELDLLDQRATEDFFRANRPEVVILAAARVGGIGANIADPYGFLYENLQIQNNVINGAAANGVKKLVFLGSSCIYPRECPQPMKEEYLLTGPLEPTNEGYALAKIAGLRLVQYLSRQYGIKGLSVMPCNLYGPGDSFHPDHSHVIAALVRRFVEAKREKAPAITLWGTGSARREFLHVDDMARAVTLLMDVWDSPEIINLGSGEDISIKGLAEEIKKAVAYDGEILWDSSKPDGMPIKRLDVSKLRGLGFEPRIPLSEGIARMIDQYEKLREERQNGV